MSVEKFSVSFDHELGRQIRELAEADDVTVSAFLAEAARERVRQLTFARWLDDAAHDLGLSRADLEQQGRAILDSVDRHETQPARRRSKRSAA